MNALADLILPFLMSNPHLAVLITVMSVARVVFKPACALVQLYVDATPGESDNQKWKALQEHKVFKAVAYAVDYFLSIKLPKK